MVIPNLIIIVRKITNSDKYRTRITVFELTRLSEAWERQNWIWASENYKRICLHKYIFFFLNLAFGQVGEKIKAKIGIRFT